MKTKIPIYIIVFEVVTSDGDIMPLLIFPRGLRLNTEAYIKCLEEFVLTWIEKEAAGWLYSWPQESAPCHTSRKTQCWLLENFCDHITS